MSMYSVLMVDDEEDVIRAMQKKIDWESIGLTGSRRWTLRSRRRRTLFLRTSRCLIWTGWSWHTISRSCIRL